MPASQPEIRILPSKDIDTLLWDQCIRNDPKGLIYAYSWVLNIMAEEWYGLILGNYEAVMPLPIKHKWGLRIGYVPPFIQRLGIFGDYNSEQEKMFFNTAADYLRLWQYTAANKIHIPAKQKTNFILHLDKPYQEITATYTAACKKNMAKATRRGAVIDFQQVSLIQVITLYQQAYGNKAAYKAEHYKLLEQLAMEALKRQYSILAGVRDDNSGELVYAGLLLDDGKRLYYWLGAPTEKGRQMRATYFFIDQLFQHFAQQRQIFDFEGSDIPDVAGFYNSFGPDVEYYYQYYSNKYPFPLNKLIDWQFSPLK